MTIRRIVPDIQVESAEAMRTSRDFYGLLGFEEVMLRFLGGAPRPPRGG